MYIAQHMLHFVSSLVLTGKKHRLTIIECGCDINTMIDLAKVADLVSCVQWHTFCYNTYFGKVSYTSEKIHKIQIHIAVGLGYRNNNCIV